MLDSSQTILATKVQMSNIMSNIKPLSSISCSVSGRELRESSWGWEIQEEPEQGGAEEEQGGSERGVTGSAGVRGGAGQRGGAET